VILGAVKTLARGISAIALLVLAACGYPADRTAGTPAPTPAPVSTVVRRTTTSEVPTEEPASTDDDPVSAEPESTPVTTATPEPASAAGDATSTSSPAATTTSTTTASTTTSTTTTRPPDPPPPNESFAEIGLGLEHVLDIESPTALAWRPDDPAMFVASQTGQVQRVGDELGLVVDLSAEIAPVEPGSERGLLGLAFDPRNSRMYLDYTGLDNNTRVVSFELDDAAVAVPDSRREILFIDQPGLGHNGGRLLFEDEGNLYIGSGDGGASNGRDAQDTTKLLGVILRIAPSLDGESYTIPTDNPFADGVDDRPEVWARGLRNPWTFSLDDDTGDMWIGDVGNERREEIDIIPAGTSGPNFGWYWFEGTSQRFSEVPDGLVPPVFDYPRSQGVAVMGGYVYRGQAIPELRGAYLFGDLGGPIWAIGASGVTRLRVDPVNGLVGWGEDPSGELYLLGIYDGVFRLTPG
jgi:glucose/arabinose dehydrogenase